MAFDWGATAQDTLEALVDAGGAEPGVTLTRTPKGAYDPALGEAAPSGAPIVTRGVGLTFDYGLQNSGAGTSGGSLIQAGDRQLLLSSLTAAGVAIPLPVKGDSCLAPDGVTYNVENVKTLAPAGVAVLYELQLRR